MWGWKWTPANAKCTVVCLTPQGQAAIRHIQILVSKNIYLSPILRIMPSRACHRQDRKLGKCQVSEGHIISYWSFFWNLLTKKKNAREAYDLEFKGLVCRIYQHLVPCLTLSNISGNISWIPHTGPLSTVYCVWTAGVHVDLPPDNNDNSPVILV